MKKALSVLLMVVLLLSACAVAYAQTYKMSAYGYDVEMTEDQWQNFCEECNIWDYANVIPKEAMLLALSRTMWQEENVEIHKYGFYMTQFFEFDAPDDLGIIIYLPVALAEQIDDIELFDLTLDKT